MFKKVPTPFKGTKKRSKDIVGRVVEVDGKEIDENHNSSNNSVKSSSSFPKSKFPSSASRIFGASPFKKTSTTRTPGRKFLKKLICTPGKARSFPDTSISEIDDFGVYIPNNSTSGLTLSRSISSEETKETKGIKASYSGQMPHSPPNLARKILEGNNSNQVLDSENTMKSTTKTQSEQISNSIDSGKIVDDALVAASNSSDLKDDIIFLSNSTSSDEYDRRSESDMMPRVKSSSPYASPMRFERQSSPSKTDDITMKAPGFSIPTPAMAKPRENSNGSYVGNFTGSALPFPHPLRSIYSSPTERINATTPNPKDLSTNFEECEDDDAFLPNDFVVPCNNAKKDEVTYCTHEEVERMITQAKREERISLRKQHEEDIEERQKEFERVLIESGSQWKKDADEQEARYQKLLKEERHKTSLKHHELINKARSLQDINDNLKEVEAERELLNLRVRDLETSEEKINEAKIQEIQSVRNDNKNAKNRILELTSELESVDPLRKEKEAAEHKVAELSERLQLLTESDVQSQNKIEEAHDEISLLRGQLAKLPTIDHEEIRSFKLEVESLRSLRAEDGKEIQALQNKLSEIVDEHQDVLTPQKKGINSDRFGSTCVVEIDTLRVDYDKAQVQLRAMGKILKRYKNEKDSIKTKMQELEKQHVQAIKIAVQQAIQDQKEKIQLLMEENEVLRQQPKDIGEKIIEEMKNHIEDLKRAHEVEILELRGSLDKEIKNAEEHEKALKAQFDIENKKLKENYDKQIDSLNEKSDQNVQDKNKELSLLQSSSKEEIDSLQDELRKIKIESENEKIEIINSKEEELKTLENQIESMNKLHNEELELVAFERREEVENLKEKNNELTKELDSKTSGTITEDVVNNIKSDFEKTLQERDEKVKAEKSQLATKISSLKEVRDAETEKAMKFEAELNRIQTQNAARIEEVKNEYERKISEVKSEHAIDSDKFFAELDLFEAEATQRLKNAQAAVSEKDAVITALGSQFAESESRCATSSKEYGILKEEVEALRSDLEIVTSANELSQNNISSLIERHKKEIEEQISLREGACNEAREEMIALAEGQLAERQEYYQALKRELDNALSKISVLERDLRFAKKELEEMNKRQEAREADLKDELAQSKAAIATKDANLTRAEKVHEAELNRVREAEMTMKSKFEEAQATSHSVQKTLASLVTEKQRLERELEEVTAISEELATLCEKNKLM